MVQESEQRRGAPHQADVLVALSTLRELRRVSAADVAPRMQRSEGKARSVLEELAEAGLAEGQGVNKERNYTLSARVYRELDQRLEYVRQAATGPLSRDAQVLEFVRAHGSVSRREARDLCGLTDDAAKNLLLRLVDEGRLRPIGQDRNRRYEASASPRH